MALNVDEGHWGAFSDDVEALLRLQNILLQAAEGARDYQLDLEYRALRKALIGEPKYAGLVPSFVQSNRDLNSMWAYFKSYDGKWEARRKLVREAFLPLIDLAEQPAPNFNVQLRNPQSSSWTGSSSGRDRLVAVQTYIPVAQASVETLIATLEAPKPNGAPLLDEHVEALTNLRMLHSALGSLLEAADEGRLAAEINNGLLDEVARYGKRAARELRNDPIPYAISAMMLALLSAAGVDGLAAYMAGIALNIRKNNRNP